MKKYESIEQFFAEPGPADVERFVDKNLDISQQVFALLKEKGWTQSDLAKKLGKTSAEISKWLSGSHNLTLRSIAKMEAILEEDIIMTPQKARRTYSKVHFATMRYHAVQNKLSHKDLKYSTGEVASDKGKRSSQLKISVA